VCLPSSSLSLNFLKYVHFPTNNIVKLLFNIKLFNDNVVSPCTMKPICTEIAVKAQRTNERVGPHVTCVYTFKRVGKMWLKRYDFNMTNTEVQQKMVESFETVTQQQVIKSVCKLANSIQ